jgi:hypothetical protein
VFVGLSVVSQPTIQYNTMQWNTRDFDNQQGISYAPPGIPFSAGDGFLTRCSYSSLGRRNETTWGEGAEVGLVSYGGAPRR